MLRKKKKTFRRLTNDMRGKLGIVFLGIMCLFFVLVVRLIYINLTNGSQYEKMVLSSQRSESKIIPYERGNIYDRDGNTLATNQKIYSLILEPKNILENDGKYRDTTLDTLVEYFGFSREKMAQVIDEHPDSYYEVYKKDLTFDQVEAFMNLMDKAGKSTGGASEKEAAEIRKANTVRGVSFEESYSRYYPYDTMACRLLGFTSSGNVGNWGLEQQYNSELNGINGRNYYYFDQELNLEKNVIEPINGNSVVSTINIQIQQVIEEKLRQYDEKVGSNRTSILVMDPRNGEILAMASSYPYNLNEPSNEDALGQIFSKDEIARMKTYTKKKQAEEEAGYKDKKKKKDENKEEEKTIYDGFYELWRNAVISDTYEPGSTYKPFTVATGLESGVLNGNETYYCTGSLPVGKRNIGCSHVHGDITLKQAVAKSCNVAMMNIAFKEGPETFYKYQNVFGFGRKTGIDLPGEAETGALVYNAENYNNSVTIATNSFGQNFNCTMIEMAAAFCSLVNGGNYYQPHVMKQIVNQDGDVIRSYQTNLMRKTVSENTSRILRSYMKETVIDGTGTRAKIDGYSIGGKTGTAEKIPRNKEDYYISFVGFTPVDAPELLIYVTIDEPNVEDQDNAGLAVNLEKQCMKEIVKILGIEPDQKVKPKDPDAEENTDPYDEIYEDNSDSADDDQEETDDNGEEAGDDQEETNE